MIETRSCWVITTGEAGMRSQALGLAESVGLPVVEKRVNVRPPWSWLPAGAAPVPLWMLTPGSDPIEPPWPALIIACGRRAIGPALAARRRSGGKTLAVYVQDPGLARSSFDLVVAPSHDRVAGPNVLPTPTALHRVSKDRLLMAADEWRGRLSSSGAPLIGVLLGGDTRHYRFGEEAVAQLVAVLRKAHEAHGFASFLTPSRRTGQDVTAALRQALGGHAWATVWDGSGPNPYFGILALADRLIVTGDSVSMISESLATGRPVHVLQLQGRGRRHKRFLANLVAGGLVSVIEGDDLDWSRQAHRPLNATRIAAERVRDLMRDRGIA